MFEKIVKQSRSSKLARTSIVGPSVWQAGFYYERTFTNSSTKYARTYAVLEYAKNGARQKKRGARRKFS